MIRVYTLLLTAGTILAQPAPPELDIVSTCGSSKRPMFVMNLGFAGSSGGQAKKGITLDECADHCRSNKDFQSKAYLCTAYDYNSNKRCTIYSEFNPAALRQVEGTNFYLKQCIDGTLEYSIPFLFEMHPQRILIGFAKEVVKVNNVEACYQACAESRLRYAFECKSLMYYPGDGECILNTENRRNRPDLFLNENRDSVLYADNNRAGAYCDSPFTINYVAVEGMALSGEYDDEAKIFTAASLEGCAAMCTDNIYPKGEFVCKSFMYKGIDGTCILSDEQSKPLGRAELVEMVDVVYYEKGCYKAANTGRSIPAAVRMPQKIMSGFAAYVMEEVPTVEACLDICKKPPRDHVDRKFKCRSAMYYYEQQECILNSEDRTSKPSLIHKDTSGFHVDFFDIPSQDQCPPGTSLTAILVRGTVSVKSDDPAEREVRSEPSVVDCKRACEKHRDFTCRTFEYNERTQECVLSVLSADATILTRDDDGRDFYELICVRASCEGPAGFERSQGQRLADLRPSRLLSGPVGVTECLTTCAQDGCTQVNFDKETGECTFFSSPGNLNDPGGALQDAPNVDTYTNLCAPPARSGITTICRYDGLAVQIVLDEMFTGAVFARHHFDTCRVEVTDNTRATLLLGFPPRTVDYTIPALTLPETGGFGYGSSQHVAGQKHDGTAHKAGGGGGYGKNVAHGHEYPGEKKEEHAGYGSQESSSYGGSSQESYGSSPGYDASAPGYGSPGSSGGYERRKRADAAPRHYGPPGAQSSGGYAKEPPPYSKLHSAYGSSGGPDQVPAEAAPPAERLCGVEDLGNGTYCAVIVIQTNPMGVPGLVTNADEIYRVCCDYGPSGTAKAVASATMTALGPSPQHVKPYGKVNLASPIMLQMTDGNGKPKSTVLLGDAIQLRWELMALDIELDFFVKKCVASRPPKTGSYDPDQGESFTGPKPMVILDGGCPTDGANGKIVTGGVEVVSENVKMLPIKAFRFDGSRTVQITCQLTLCKGDCAPVQCNGKDSFGRKKRSIIDEVIFDPTQEDLTNNEDIFTEHYIVKPKQSTSASFTIVDVLPEPQPLTSHQTNDALLLQPQIGVVSYEDAENKLCFQRQTFITGFVLMCLLVAGQLIGIVGCQLQRAQSNRKLGV